MEKVEIEKFVSNKIREVVDDAISKAIIELNNSGHHFQAIEGAICEWAEPRSEESLKINCALGVGLSARSSDLQPDPVVESFISRAESGHDKDATLLNLLEGDIANGGFFQLYENKGESFILKGISLLKKIGSKSVVRLVEQALELIREEKNTIAKYRLLNKKLNHLDTHFYKLHESIPSLYEQYCQQKHS